MDVVEKIRLLSDVRVLSDVDGSGYSNFKSGGIIRNMIAPTNVYALCATINALDEEGVDYRLLGLGANTLIADDGVDQPVVRVCGVKGIDIESDSDGAYVTAACGTSIAELGQRCSARALSGLEWSIGIPSTVGAAIYNNIGAYGYQICDVLHSVTAYYNGRVITIDRSDAQMEYRNSIFKRTGGMTILSATLRLARRSISDIDRDRKAYLDRRASTQPDLPSLGSAFLRSEGKSIAPYIQALGLKGCFYGGAMVSEKHAGYVVNAGGATTMDYLILCDTLQKKVYRNYGIRFLAEVEYIGRPNEYYDRLKGLV